jgi:hypothetical protein
MYEILCPFFYIHAEFERDQASSGGENEIQS